MKEEDVPGLERLPDTAADGAFRCRLCGLSVTVALALALAAQAERRVIETRPLAVGADNILSDTIGFLPERTAKSRRNPMCNAVREIKVRIETGAVLRIVSNDLDAPATEIAALYKRRWSIELFFRWVKQTLKIKHFYGISENAVRIQIAVALIAFVLIRLAHIAQSAVESPTRFARLIGATVMHRKRIDRLIGSDLCRDTPAVQNHAQGCLTWT